MLLTSFIACTALSPLTTPLMSRRTSAAPAATTVRMDVQPWQARLPNQLTFCRVAAVPVLAAAFYAPQAAAARVPAMLFGVIAFTDFLDGFLARRWQVESALGAFLDPVADKFVVCTTFVLLSGALGAVVAAPTALVICREIGVSALRERLAALGAAKSAAPADLEP